MREHVRLTIQPFDGPRDAATIQRLIEQFDGDQTLPPGLPDSLVRKILFDNPLATYPRLKESLQ